MNYKNFCQIIEQYRSIDADFNELHKLGFDFYEGKYQIVSKCEKMLREIMQSEYNDYGWEWISWFIWENEYGDKKLEAWDAEENLIAQTLEELHHMLEKEYKNEACENA